MQTATAADHAALLDCSTKQPLDHDCAGVACGCIWLRLHEPRCPGSHKPFRNAAHLVHCTGHPPQCIPWRLYAAERQCSPRQQCKLREQPSHPMRDRLQPEQLHIPLGRCSPQQQCQLQWQWIPVRRQDADGRLLGTESDLIPGLMAHGACLVQVIPISHAWTQLDIIRHLRLGLQKASLLQDNNSCRPGALLAC